MCSFQSQKPNPTPTPVQRIQEGSAAPYVTALLGLIPAFPGKQSPSGISSRNRPANTSKAVWQPPWPLPQLPGFSEHALPEGLSEQSCRARGAAHVPAAAGHSQPRQLSPTIPAGRLGKGRPARRTLVVGL